MCQLIVFKKCAMSGFMWMFSAALKFLCTKSTRHTDVANKGGAVLKLFVENLPITEVKNRSHTIKPAGSERICCKKTKTEDFRSYRRSPKSQESSTVSLFPVTHNTSPAFHQRRSINNLRSFVRLWFKLLSADCSTEPLIWKYHWREGGGCPPCNLNSFYHQPVFHLDSNIRPNDDIADELLIKSVNSKKGTNLECCFCSLILRMCKNLASPIGQILSQCRFAQRWRPELAPTSIHPRRYFRTLPQYPKNYEVTGKVRFPLEQAAKS